MGVDLTILPVTMGSFDSEVGGLAHSMLLLDRRRDLWDAIGRDVPRNLVPPGKLTGYLASREDGESEYGVMDEDPYGDQLEWCRADHLARCIGEFNTTDRGAPMNVAIHAFLAALPGDTPVVLYWHRIIHRKELTQ